MPPDVHVALYRLAQESVNNILKHSHAQEFAIALQYETDQVTLHIQDNGIGFDITQSTSGMGLSNLRERAEAINAQLDIISAPEKGTTIQVVWPTPSVDGAAKP